MTTTADRKHTCDKNCQVFRWAVHCWCITYIQQRLDADPSLAVLDTGNIDGLRPFLAHYLRPEDHDPNSINLMAYSDLDVDHALTVDLSRPLLIATIYNADGKEVSPMLVDGWHRVYRALTENRTTLPVQVLTAELSEGAKLPVYVR